MSRAMGIWSKYWILIWDGGGDAVEGFVVWLERYGCILVQSNGLPVVTGS